MNTKIYTMSETAPDMKMLSECADIIKKSGLVAFPTETVYGLGGDATNAESASKIYAAKGRPSDNPLIVHIAYFDEWKPLVNRIFTTRRFSYTFSCINYCIIG